MSTSTALSVRKEKTESKCSKETVQLFLGNLFGGRHLLQRHLSKINNHTILNNEGQEYQCGQPVCTMN